MSSPPLCRHRMWHSPRPGPAWELRRRCPCCGKWRPWRPFCWCVWLHAGTRLCTSCCLVQLCASSELCCLPFFKSTWATNRRSAGVLPPLLTHTCHSHSLPYSHSLTKPWHAVWLSKVKHSKHIPMTYYLYLPSHHKKNIHLNMWVMGICLSISALLRHSHMSFAFAKCSKYIQRLQATVCEPLRQMTVS